MFCFFINVSVLKNKLICYTKNIRIGEYYEKNY